MSKEAQQAKEKAKKMNSNAFDPMALFSKLNATKKAEEDETQSK